MWLSLSIRREGGVSRLANGRIRILSSILIVFGDSRSLS